MKQLSQLLTALVFCSLMIFISCGGGGTKEDPDPADAVGAKLVSTWSLSSVKVDGTARDEWTNFTLNIGYDPATNTGTFSAPTVPSNNGASDVWPSSGTFTLAVGNTTTATRSDGVPISVDVDAAALVLTFTITGSGNRVAAFDGNWEFSLAK